MTFIGQAHEPTQKRLVLKNSLVSEQKKKFYSQYHRKIGFINKTFACGYQVLIWLTFSDFKIPVILPKFKTTILWKLF